MSSYHRVGSHDALRGGGAAKPDEVSAHVHAQLSHFARACSRGSQRQPLAAPPRLPNIAAAHEAAARVRRVRRRCQHCDVSSPAATHRNGVGHFARPRKAEPAHHAVLAHIPAHTCVLRACRDDEVELPDADGPSSPHPESSRRATTGPSSATRVVDAAVAAHRAQPAMGATSYARTLGGGDFGGSPATASRSFSGGAGAYGILSRQQSLMMGVGGLSLHSAGSVGESEDLVGLVAAQRATIERLTADKAQLSAELETANFRVTTSHSGSAAHSKISAVRCRRCTSPPWRPRARLALAAPNCSLPHYLLLQACAPSFLPPSLV